jgi:A circularly permuted ATPgrasp
VALSKPEPYTERTRLIGLWALATGAHDEDRRFVQPSMVMAHIRRENPAVSSGVQTHAIDGYRPQAPFLDEMFAPDGTPRPTAGALVEVLKRLGPEGLAEAGRRRDAIFMQQGITFETSGVSGASHERPFPLDLIPRVLSGEEWRAIKRGLAQRIRALNHFVDDVYHAREIVREGIVPWRLVASCSHFARAVHGIRPPGGVYTHVAGCDLVRHSDGTWKVIEDNVRIPSGISYVLENRAAMARLVPELFASAVRPTSRSATGASTPTSLRSRACTWAGRARGSRPPCGCRGSIRRRAREPESSSSRTSPRSCRRSVTRSACA